MKSRITFRKFFSGKAGWLVVLLVLAVFFTSCYEFFKIDQPTEAYNNSSFDVSFIVKDDGGGNDWTVSDLQNIGLFGALIPDGWSVKDSIAFNIVTEGNAFDNSGFLKYNADLSLMLEDSIGSPTNYHWWGAKTTENADMSYFDSLYFTITVITDGQLGTFNLQYTVGDEDYWDRNPADDKSDPMPIEITENPNPNSISLVNIDGFSVYPNPTADKVFVDMNWEQSPNANLEAYDAAGKLIKSLEINKINNSIDLSQQPSGIYFIKVRTNSGSATQKILVQ